MSQSYCYDLWQASIRELHELLKLHPPGDHSGKEGWAQAYVRYLGVMHQLAEVHAHVRQPQQREAVAAATKACAGLTATTWATLVAANEGVDVVNLTPALIALGNAPGDVELPASLLARLRRPLVKSLAQALAAARDEEKAVSSHYLTERLAGRPWTPPILPTSTRRRNLLAPAAAATAIQAAWRGHADRKRAHNELSEEKRALGMTFPRDLSSLLSSERLAEERTERRQRELEQAYGDVETLMRGHELPLMVLEERNAALSSVEARVAMGRGPEISLSGPLDPSAPAANAALSFKEVGAKGPQNPGTPRAAVLPASPTVSGMQLPPKYDSSRPQAVVASLMAEMERVMTEWHVVWEQRAACNVSYSDSRVQKKDEIEYAASALEGLALPRRGSSLDAVDVTLVEGAVRGKLREEAVVAGWEQARATAAAANAALAPPPAPPIGDTKGAALKKLAATRRPSAMPGGRKKEGGKEEDAAAAKDPESLFQELSQLQLVRRPSQVMLADFLGENCFAPEACEEERTAKGPVVRKLKYGGKAANRGSKTAAALLPYPKLSMPQARQLLAVQCALPLAAWQPGTPQPQGSVSVLIYGPAGCGKTLLTEAVAHEVGAALFDLSPAAIAGRFPGKEINTVVASVFAAAKAAAPAIISIDEVEKVFIRDPSRAAALAAPGTEPANRMRVALETAAANLNSNDGVLLVGNSREPQACVAADEADLISFFQMLVQVPLPDAPSRRQLLKHFSAAHGVEWEAGKAPAWHQLSLAAHLTAGLTPGQLKRAVEAAAGEVKRQPVKAPRVRFLDCVVEAAAAEKPVEEAQLTALEDWTMRAHASKRLAEIGEGGDATKTAEAGKRVAGRKKV